MRLSEIAEARFTRMRSGFGEFDALLGGGLVAGSLVLLGGPPGAGKSTLLLQIVNALAERGASAIYVCGEESAAQTKLRAARIGATDDLLVFPETNLRAILDECERRSPDVIVVDSIQTMSLPEVESFAGSVLAGARLHAGTDGVRQTHWLRRVHRGTRHEGRRNRRTAAARAPRRHGALLRKATRPASTASYARTRTASAASTKSAFSRWTIPARTEITDPSALFLAVNAANVRSGSCVVPSVVGSRPVLVEVQALVGETSYGTPRRLATNVDAARLTTIVAILERRAGMQLGGHDIYCSVAGGLRIVEPAADLGIALAIASASRRSRMRAPST